jgi:hypothetical protein
VLLQASLTSPRPIDDALVERIADKLLFAPVSHVAQRELTLSMPLRFDGGVTVDWMANAFQHWFSAWRTCERLLERTRTAHATKPTCSPDPTVH